MKAEKLQIAICFALFFAVYWYKEGIGSALYTSGQLLFSFIIIGVFWLSVVSLKTKSLQLFNNKLWLVAAPFLFAFPFIAHQTP
jgi:hypothetical protein